MNAAPPSLRVLVCDDEPTLRHIFSSRLKEAGIAAVTCPVPDRAWDLAVAGPFSAHVVDLVYHGHPEGCELIRRLKSDPRTASAPAIAVTGFGAIRLDEAQAAGADFVAAKTEFRESVIPYLLEHAVPVSGAPPPPAEVLVVEDDEGLRDLYALAPEDAELAFKTAPDLREAWHLLVTRQPEALVLDRTLPDGDGLSLCARARRLPYLRETAIVVLTADPALGESERWYAAGADMCLTKPASLTRLAGSIKGLLRRRSPNQPARVALGTRSTLDRVRRRLLIEGAAPVKLTPVQTAFLELFDLQEVVSRHAALAVTEIRSEPPGDELALNAFVHRLRRKIPDGEKALVAVRSEGYRLSLP